MSISAVTRTDETTSPKTGVLRVPCTRANGAGNIPSSAAASGTRPWIRIQPLSAPKVETSATSAMTLSQPPPKIWPAASANGLVDAASSCVGMMPMIATVARM
jgi:hypothetical protein